MLFVKIVIYHVSKSILEISSYIIVIATREIAFFSSTYKQGSPLIDSRVHNYTSPNNCLCEYLFDRAICIPSVIIAYLVRACKVTLKKITIRDSIYICDYKSAQDQPFYIHSTILVRWNIDVIKNAFASISI